MAFEWMDFPNWKQDHNEKARASNLKPDFLDPGRKYVAAIYKDAPAAHWDSNPAACVMEQMEVDQTTRLNIPLAEGGGFALSITSRT